MKSTRYFNEQVLRKRPYIQMEWCQKVIQQPLKTERQPNGRVRFWGKVPEFSGKILRVVTLEDGQTLHNAFFDRNFKV